MSQNSLSDFIVTPGSNTDFQGTGVLGSDLVSTADDAFRTLAAMLKSGVVTGYTTTATAAGTTTLTANSNSYQYFTGATTQIVAMPVTSTLELGRVWRIVNNSTGVLTVNSSGGNLIATVPAGGGLSVQCILITGTTAASWSLPALGGSGLAVNSASAGTLATLTSTDAGATVGPVLDLYRDSASPAGGDLLAEIQFNGRDSAANKQLYGRMSVTGTAVTSGAEVGAFILRLADGAGAESQLASLTGNAGGTFNFPCAFVTLNSTTLFELSTSATSAAAPQFTFSTDPDTGIYYIGANNFGVAAAGAKVLDISATGLGITGTMVSSGVATVNGTGTSVIAGPLNIAGASAGQIVFPAAQNASANANTLDDIEEGTFSLTQSFATVGTSTWATTSSIGDYYKVGKWVQFMCRSTSTPTKGTGAGNLQVGNFPFTSVNPSVHVFPVMLSTANVTFSAGRTMLTATIGNSAVLFTFLFTGSAVTAAALTAATMTDGVASTIDISGVMETAS